MDLEGGSWIRVSLSLRYFQPHVFPVFQTSIHFRRFFFLLHCKVEKGAVALAFRTHIRHLYPKQPSLAQG